MKKMCLVCSSGGHLKQLYLIDKVWKNYDRIWVSFDKEDANSLLKDESKISCYFPTNRNVINLIRNFYLAFKVLKNNKPDVVVSSGAAIAIPFFYLSKLFKIKTVYIEIIDRVDKPTLTGKIVYPVTDLFVVQNESLKKVYPKAVNLGSVF